MSKRTVNRLMGLGLVLVLGLLLAACQGPTQVVPPTQPAPPEPTSPPPEPTATALPALEIPFEDEWADSAHANAEAEAFVHWNEEDPAEIPAACAKCHSTPGFQDYVGADGSRLFQVDKNHVVGTVIACEACHNQATVGLDTVSFPSGVELTDVGDQAVCMTCHQGTASKVQVDENLEAVGAAENLDEPVAELGFTNIHYYAAAVSRYGTIVQGGYEYDGKAYDARFDHAVGVNTCTDCHDPHSLEIKIDLCAECHDGVDNIEEIRAIRMESSAVDYDGDGDIREGIASEVEGLREMLYTAMQAYSQEVAGTGLVYTEASYPYFFIDMNGNGEIDEDEASFNNRFNAWTGRLAKAAYNFQTSLKDPGGYVHGGKYIIALLYDSIEDLNSQLTTPVDLSTAHRIDPGHFAGSEEAWRHWDAEGEVPGTCAKCHSGTGLPTFIANNTNVAVEPSNSMLCETCHSDLATFDRYVVNSVPFPSGANITFGEGAESNLCLECHQGRESTVSVNRAIGDLGPDEINERLTFRNVHYFAAGATLFGDAAMGAYQYEGQEYNGIFTHVQGFQTCVECHDPHALEPNYNACQGCHQVSDPSLIRWSDSTDDYDGDGDVEEGLEGEIDTMREILYESFQAYAAETLGQAIVYDPSAHPYFFNDTNGNGEPDADEVTNSNRFASWSPRLLRAAYNYQYAAKDPGAFAHNGKYILQVLYDSIADVGGDVTNMVRPPVEPAPGQ